jgi:hypothetical protein
MVLGSGYSPISWLHGFEMPVWVYPWLWGMAAVAVVLGAVAVWDCGRRELAWRERIAWWRFCYEHRMYWWQHKPRVERKTFIYTGLPGSGKTMVGLVRDGIQAMRQGAMVGANFSIRDPLSGREAVAVSSWLDVLGLAVWALENEEDVLILIDEGHNWADARLWQQTTKYAPWLFYMLAQKRHYGIGLEFSTQALKQMEVRVRDLVDGVVMCEPVRLIRWLFRGRMPVYRCTLYRPNIEVDEMEAEHGMPSRWVWAPARARFGYSTTELVGTEDFTRYSEDAVKELISELTRRAIEAARVREIAVFGAEVPFENEWQALRAQMVACLWADGR